MTHELNLTRAELAERIDALAGGYAEAPLGAYVVAGTEAAAELGRHLERAVFGEVFGNTPELLAAEYGPYEETSVFLLVLDHRRHVPAGVIRLILPSPAGHKSLRDLEHVWGLEPVAAFEAAGAPFHPERIWDVATLAVDDDYRGERTGGLVSLALYQATATLGLRAPIAHLVAVLDTVVLGLIQQVARSPFTPFPGAEPMRYLDSPESLPVVCDLPAWAARLRPADPALHEVLCEGRGLEAAIAPPDWGQALEIVRRLSGTGPATTGGVAPGSPLPPSPTRAG
ncbi:MAG: hypothetical protein HYU28_03940 [Actinobacteria bacterium]|nr:hypothetical protein [Actinomycetota bacterium]